MFFSHMNNLLNIVLLFCSTLSQIINSISKQAIHFTTEQYNLVIGTMIYHLLFPSTYIFLCAFWDITKKKKLDVKGKMRMHSKNVHKNVCGQLRWIEIFIR